MPKCDYPRGQSPNPLFFGPALNKRALRIYNSHMRTHNLRRWLAVLFVLISLILLVWGLWPAGAAVQILPLDPSDMQVPTPEGLLPWLSWLV